MTLESTSNVKAYVGNGSQTEFDYDFLILDEDDLSVYHRDSDGNETLLTKDTDYSVDSGVGEDEGGTITFPLAGSTFSTLASDETLTLAREVPYTQEKAFGSYYSLPTSEIEAALDRTVMLAQQLKEELDRTLKYSITVPEDEREDVNDLITTISGYATDAEASKVAAEAAEVNAEAAEDSAVAAAAKVPDVAAGDADKVLQVKDDESGAEWNALSAIITSLYASGSAKVAANANGAVVTGRIYQTEGYQELFVPAGAMIPRDTNGATAATVELATNDIMLDVYDFDGATSEGVGFWLSPPPEWDRTTLKVKPVWMPASGASGGDGVSWEIKTRSVGDDGALDSALNAGANCDDSVTAGTSGDLHIGSATSLTVSHSIGDVMYVEVSRDVADAGDDMTEDARLIGLIVQFKLSNDQNPW